MGAQKSRAVMGGALCALARKKNAFAVNQGLVATVFSEPPPLAKRPKKLRSLRGLAAALAPTQISRVSRRRQVPCTTPYRDTPRRDAQCEATIHISRDDAEEFLLCRRTSRSYNWFANPMYYRVYRWCLVLASEPSLPRSQFATCAYVRSNVSAALSLYFNHSFGGNCSTAPLMYPV